MENALLLLTKAKRELMRKFYSNFNAEQVEEALSQYGCLRLEKIKIIHNFFPEFKYLRKII